ncbi:LuxR C-terminal-related transcriptional regulator [Wenxinia marina]|uniref:Response regulator n=1 Tax=Wenxinia marina DSM 24838 TaxID=1123501 RepID=A0A0D0PAU7_9RHOB|nr:LuxR C-terminal-related transcriptional regulator [Wenxinia marina]KIQ68581.1 Response regulator [Wenxinia marina DSM 24838]GGL67049.1 helix-turn-helix transcriptional regulator [Wenxinia marina]
MTVADRPARPGGDDTDPAEDLIDRLYEVAIDPTRYEALLDHWEAMIAPQRVAANGRPEPDQGLALGLRRLESHIQRADAVLDRAIADGTRDGPSGMVRGVETAAAFAVDRALSIVAVNTAASHVFGVAVGARIADLALSEGEADLVARQIGRMFAANSPAPVVMRTRGAAEGRVVLLHLRIVRERMDEPFVLAVSSELGWPDDFSDLLRGAFDLTPAEVEVVRALAEGARAEQIAEARGRSVATIRAQIKSIMAKTETRSQTELVRLTLSTMEMARFSDDEAARLTHASRGTGTLEPRPFRTLILPDGRRSDHLVLGDPDGTPILFFPLDYGLVRWPASAEAEAAARGIKIVVPVRAGYGASDPIPRGTPYVTQLCEDFARLMDHHGIDSCPILTLGGDSFLAIAFHAAFPERVSALVCAAGVLPLTRPEQYERMEKWHRFILAGARYTPHLLPFMVKAGFALARRLGKRGFVHAVYGKCPADVATFEIPEVFEAMVCGSDVSLSDTHSAHDAFSREVISHETTDWTDEIDQLRESGLPVTFLNGLQDPQVPAETLAEHRADYPWIDFRVMPDAGQLLFFLKWRDVLAVLAPLLTDRAARTRAD